MRSVCGEKEVFIFKGSYICSYLQASISFAFLFRVCFSFTSAGIVFWAHTCAQALFPEGAPCGPPCRGGPQFVCGHTQCPSQRPLRGEFPAEALVCFPSRRSRCPRPRVRRRVSGPQLPRELCAMFLCTCCSPRASPLDRPSRCLSELLVLDQLT